MFVRYGDIVYATYRSTSEIGEVTIVQLRSDTCARRHATWISSYEAFAFEALDQSLVHSRNLVLVVLNKVGSIEHLSDVSF